MKVPERKVSGVFYLIAFLFTRFMQYRVWISNILKIQPQFLEQFHVLFYIQIKKSEGGRNIEIERNCTRKNGR